MKVPREEGVMKEDFPAAAEPGQNLPACIDGPLLFDDRYPWYHQAPAGDPSADGTVAAAFRWAVGQEWAAAQARELARTLVDAGSVVLVPLMSGALLWDAVLPVCEERGAAAALVPMSKHPFVTLSADDPGSLAATCALYEWSSSRLSILPEWFKANWQAGRRKVVMLDANTAAGRDAELLRFLVQRWVGGTPEFSFGVLVNETTESPEMTSGWRSGRKSLQPDAFAVRLVGDNTKYLSHITFLLQPEDIQLSAVRRIRAAHPRLTAFWDEMIPDDLRHIHGYQQSQLFIHRERLHARFGPGDTQDWQDAIRSALSRPGSRPELTIDSAAWQRRHDYICRWYRRLTNSQS